MFAKLVPTDLEDVFGGRARRVSGADEGRVEARDVGPALAPRLDERHCLHQGMPAIWAPFCSGAQTTAGVDRGGFRQMRMVIMARNFKYLGMYYRVLFCNVTYSCGPANSAKLPPFQAETRQAVEQPN